MTVMPLEPAMPVAVAQATGADPNDAAVVRQGWIGDMRNLQRTAELLEYHHPNLQWILSVTRLSR